MVVLDKIKLDSDGARVPFLEGFTELEQEAVLNVAQYIVSLLSLFRVKLDVGRGKVFVTQLTRFIGPCSHFITFSLFNLNSRRNGSIKTRAI